MKLKNYILALMLFLLATSAFFKQDVYAVDETEITSGKEYKERLTPDTQRTLEYVLKVDKSGYQYLSFSYKPNEQNKLKKGFILTLRDKDKKLIHRLETTEETATTPKMGIKKGDPLYLTIEGDFAFLDPVNGAEISFVMKTVKDKQYEMEDNNTLETANRMDNNIGKTGNLHAVADEDWFAYKIPANGTTNVYITVDNTSGRDVKSGYKVEVYDGNKNLIKSVPNIVESASISDLNFKKGQMLYFKVFATDFNNVPDMVNYSILPISARDKFAEIEPNDTAKKATSFKKKITGYLIDENDVDHFIYKAKKKKKYKVMFKTGELYGKKYSITLYTKEKGKTKKKFEKVVSENKTFSVKLKKNSQLVLKVKGMVVDVPLFNDYTILVK